MTRVAALLVVSFPTPTQPTSIVTADLARSSSTPTPRSPTRTHQAVLAPTGITIAYRDDTLMVAADQSTDRRT